MRITNDQEEQEPHHHQQQIEITDWLDLDLIQHEEEQQHHHHQDILIDSPPPSHPQKLIDPLELDRPTPFSFNNYFDLDSPPPHLSDHHQLIDLDLHHHHQQPLSLDPSHFLSYSSSHHHHHHHPQELLPPQAINPNAIHHTHPLSDLPPISIHHLLPSIPPTTPSITPTYALDPALISASIPSRTTTTTTTTTTTPTATPTPTNPTTSIHTTTTTTTTPNPSKPDQAHPRLPIIRLPKPKANLSQPSPPHHSLPPFKRDDDQAEHSTTTTKTSHSRSSSAIILGQPFPSPTSDHKRSLSHSHTLLNPPDWEDKPSAEEYKMLSSKEKRQLRNKISARNFRHRRKQHISALEQQVAQRDQAIESLSHDLGAVRMENKELKSQVEMLKQKWADLMKKIEMSLATATGSTSSPNNPIPTSSPSGSSAIVPVSPRMKSAKSSTMIPLPNLHKDLGSHTRKPFNGVGGMAAGNVGVHTTLIPEVSVDVYQNSSSVLPHSDPAGCKLAQSDDLSPQALIEFKLGVNRSDRLTHAIVTTCHSNDQKSKTDDSNLKGVSNKLHPIIPPSTHHHQVVITGQSLDDHQEMELSHRLSKMLHDALRIGERDDDDDPSSTSSPIVDQEKIQGCLDGRFVFQLVERSPPPYPVVDSNPAHPRSTWATGVVDDRSLDSSTLEIDLLSRKISGVRL